MKICPDCKIEKDDSLFYKSNVRKDGLSYSCKSCKSERDRKYSQKNREKVLARKRQYYIQNKEKMNLNSKLHYQKTADKYKTRAKQWKSINRARHNAQCMDRHVAKMKAKPSWLSKIDLARLQEFYDLSLAISVQTGIQHHVDHIVPLRGKIVCGLHAPWNLQILSASENCSKSNKLRK